MCVAWNACDMHIVQIVAPTLIQIWRYQIYLGARSVSSCHSLLVTTLLLRRSGLLR